MVANKDRIFSTVAMGQGNLVQATCLRIVDQPLPLLLPSSLSLLPNRPYPYPPPLLPPPPFPSYPTTLILIPLPSSYPPTLHYHFSRAALIDNQECVGCEREVSTHIKRLEEKWKGLLSAITAKTQKLKEANQQQLFNEAVKDMDFWLGEV